LLAAQAGAGLPVCWTHSSFDSCYSSWWVGEEGCMHMRLVGVSLPSLPYGVYIADADAHVSRRLSTSCGIAVVWSAMRHT
jgi:hypothetical protein